MEKLPPSSSTEQVEAISAAMGMTAAVSELASEVRNVKKDTKKEQRWRRLLVVSVVLDVLLTVSLVFVSANLHQSQVNTCNSSNSVRGDDIKLWDTALADIDPAGKVITPAQVEAKDHFQKFINTTFAPVDCSKISTGIF